MMVTNHVIASHLFTLLGVVHSWHVSALTSTADNLISKEK